MELGVLYVYYMFKVSLSRHHAAFLTTNNELFMQGSNKYGQLGNPDWPEKLKEPRLLENFGGTLPVLLDKASA